MSFSSQKCSPYHSFVCSKCKNPHKIRTRTFARRKKDKKLCSECFLRKYVYGNPEWIRKNSAAQILVQKRPGQKLKNALGVARSWTPARRKENSKKLKLQWKKESFKNKALANLSWTQRNDERFNEIISKSLHKGRFSGQYLGVFYQSLLELSFIFLCQSNGWTIKRYDLNPISYKDGGKTRKHIPDFIVNSDTIAEVKSATFTKWKRLEKNINNKLIGANKFCKKRKLKYIIFYETDIGARFYQQARVFHKYYTTKKENAPAL